MPAGPEVAPRGTEIPKVLSPPRWGHILSLALVLVTTLASLVVLLTYASMESNDQAKLKLEISKTAIQFLSVSVLGGLFAHLYRSLDRERRVKQAVHGYREAFLRSLLDVYRAVKRTRRCLRAIGLVKPASDEEVRGQEDHLQAKWKACFEQMMFLEEQQLALEELHGEIGHFPDSFTNKEELRASLETMEQYLRGILKKFEGIAGAGAGFQELKEVDELVRFTGKSVLGFKAGFSKPVETALARIRADLLDLQGSRTAG